MRVLLMFDVPTRTKSEQKHASKFRKHLIKLGFFMMQFSVYVRICKGAAAANSCVNAVKRHLPPFGNVRVLIVTEKQFDGMQLLLGGEGFNERVNSAENFVLFDIDENGEYRYSDVDLSQIEGGKNMINLISANQNSAQKPKKQRPKQPNLFEF